MKEPRTALITKLKKKQIDLSPIIGEMYCIDYANVKWIMEIEIRLGQIKLNSERLRHIAEKLKINKACAWVKHPNKTYSRVKQ